MGAKLLIADPKGNIIEHPTLSMAGRSGNLFGPVPDEELTPTPEGTKVFYLPGSQAVGWDEARGEYRLLKGYRAVAAMLQAGYTRTRLPAGAYPAQAAEKYGCHTYLPLWAYSAVGWRDGRMVAAAFRVDPMRHSETEHYDDRRIAPRVKKVLGGTTNRLIHHLGRCALEYHCFAAKNFFMERWEAPLPTAPACNAACVGCISLQPADCCPASQERIEFIPTVEELCEIAVPHLSQVERAIVSFGQGCEGEPLTVGGRIGEAVKAFRAATPKGTIHLNSNGSLPDALSEIAASGLDSVRISMNSAIESTYDSYYRPKTYKFGDVRESVRRAVDSGLFTAINLLVFPGVSDLPEEVDALMELVQKTGINMVHLRNLSIDPALYLKNLDPKLHRRKDALGIRNMALRLKASFPSLDLGYFNRPKEDFAAPLVSMDFLTGAQSS